MLGNVIIYYEITGDNPYGDIRAVAPSRINGFEGCKSFEISSKKVLDIVEGTRSPTHFCVVFNDDGDPIIKLKSEFDQSTNLVAPYLRQAVEGAIDMEVTVIVDHESREYQIILAEHARVRVWNNPQLLENSGTKDISFYITLANQPIILLDKFGFPISDLLRDGTITTRLYVSLPKAIDVYVTPFFISHGYRERRE